MKDKNSDKYVLAAGADPSLIRNDRDFLRSLGEKSVRARLSGNSALELVRFHPPEFVVCDFDLGDMQAPEFMRALRGPEAPPVLAVSADKSRGALLDCIAAGCAGYLLRPYNYDSFKKQLNIVRQGIELKSVLGDRLAKLEEQERRERELEEQERLNSPGQYYKLGCRHLVNHRYNDAILAFTRAVSLQSHYAEAYVGLAKAWRAKGRPDKYASFITKAAQAYAALEQYHRARELFTGVLRENPKAENPFLEMGFKMLKKGDMENAARTYHYAESFKPGTNIYRELARACHFTGDPAGTARAISDALSEHPGRPEASGIFERIMGGPWRPARTNPDNSSTGTIPVPDRLHELWLVVKFTWQVYKNGGPLHSGA